MERITVIGGGIMGRGIAYVASLGGYRVDLVDVKEHVIHNARETIERDMRNSAGKGHVDQAKAEDALFRIQYTVDMEGAVNQTDLVIEAVPENISLKMDIFKQLDRLCPEHTILATNTSSLSPTEIASQTSRQDRCVAMHFFNPVPKMKLVEIIRGLDTSDATVEAIKQVCERMGKETVEVKEFPGFITSRINVLIGNEAMNMLMEGVASAEDIDKALKLGLNHPMGPLELGDLVGLDTRLSILNYLHQSLGEKYRPSPLLVKYVKAGRLGRKSGRGIYEYQAHE